MRAPINEKQCNSQRLNQNHDNALDPPAGPHDDDQVNSNSQDLDEPLQLSGVPEKGENTVIHPYINGTELVRFSSDLLTHSCSTGRPCDPSGNFLPDGAPPLPWDDAAPEDFTPYTSRESYELADLLFRRNQMPEDQINDLLQIWARTLPPDCDPPFISAQDMYTTIDAMTLSSIPWKLFSVSFKRVAEEPEENNPPWKLKSYDVWFRGPHQILKIQLARRDFAAEMDFSPKKITDKETNVRRYQNFMSGEWAWDQAASATQIHFNT